MITRQPSRPLCNHCKTSLAKQNGTSKHGFKKWHKYCSTCAKAAYDDKFGFLFEQQENEVYNCWHFKFEIQHASVFYDGITDLGGLYTDCDAVPMLKVGTEWDKLPLMIDT